MRRLGYFSKTPYITNRAETLFKLNWTEIYFRPYSVNYQLQDDGSAIPKQHRVGFSVRFWCAIPPVLQHLEPRVEMQLNFLHFSSLLSVVLIPGFHTSDTTRRSEESLGDAEATPVITAANSANEFVHVFTKVQPPYPKIYAIECSAPHD